MAQTKRNSPEVSQRAMRMVFEHTPEHSSQWAEIISFAGKVGCTPETLCSWVRQAEVDREGWPVARCTIAGYLNRVDKAVLYSTTHPSHTGWTQLKLSPIYLG